MPLLIEGPALSGKTTLAAKLAARFRRARWDRRHGWPAVAIYGGPTRVESFGLPLADELAAIRAFPLMDGYLLDRLVATTVYGVADDAAARHRRRLLARELNRLGSLRLLLDCDVGTFCLRPRSPEQLGGRYDAKTALHARWAAAYADAAADLAVGDPGVPTARLHTDARWDDESLDLALDLWRAHLDRAASVAAFAPAGWGYGWPRVVLVGERYNGDATDEPEGRPFSNPTGASATLSALLDHARLGERTLYYLNAYDAAGRGLDPSALRWLAPRLVVALGSVAAEYLTSVGVAHAPFPHPQFLGRFHHGELATWGARLAALTAEAVR